MRSKALHPAATTPVPASAEDRPIRPTARAPACAEPRPHICFVALSLFPVLSGISNTELVGGAEVQQMQLVRALAADGFRISVLTADYGQPEVVDSDGVRIHRIPAPGQRGIKGLRFIHPHMTDVVSALKRIDPDIVYFRTAGFRAAAVAWYARLMRKHFVYACASDLELLPVPKEPATRRDALLFGLALRAADCILVQNLRQLQMLKDNRGRSGQIVANCYRESHTVAGDPNGHVLWVGTVKPLKSPEVFIELARRHPARRFRMVGGANHQDANGAAYFERVHAAATALPNLEFVGYVPFRDVGRHFDGASLLVNTSPNEGFPNTFLQAWIRGVPSLSFVKPEVIAGCTGTVACADLDAMEAQVAELAEEQAWRAASAACAAHFARVHSVEAALAGYRALFDSLMRRGESLASVGV